MSWDELIEKLKDISIENYHKHTSDSNPSTPDSGASYEDFAERNCEIGSRVLTSGEHGHQGNYWLVNDICEGYNSLKNPYPMKFVFSTEAYWVKDRFEKDRTNSHLVLCAKTENGRQEINDKLSEANISGYYHKPRLDLDLILSLPKNDVFITSACVKFWEYKDIDNIVLKLYNHFKDNFMLEVQCHNVEKQKEINKHIIQLSKKYGIKIIVGLDSHYIFPEEERDRQYILDYKNVKYPEEDGFYLDFPDKYETAKRLKEQGVLTNEEIFEAIKNTNVILDFEDIKLDKSVKLPNLFPNETQEQRNERYKKLLQKGWNKEKRGIPKHKWELYRSEIRKEASVVINTNMSDYFIDDYYLVKEAKKRGGKLTDTGRGSGVSYYTNKLLGFTEVDRIASPVKMYPERFMSEARILQTRSLPDLDLNWGNPEVAEEAQKIVFGDGHSYPMLARGTLKKKSAFKMYAGANNIPFDIANDISKQIDEYDKDMKYAEEAEREYIDVYDYVEEKYHYLLDDSQKYMGIISDFKKHPCAHLIYQGDIRREIGLRKIKSKTTKKEYIVAMIDGKMADKYGYVKNDLLKVDVVNNIKDIYNSLGIKIPTIQELGEKIKTDKGIQRVYHEGITMGINQFEKESTRLKSTRYKLRNISEATAFVAGIRPSFKSMYSTFENRERFSYNIKAFDKLIQTEEMPDSFLLYQEQLMSALGYAGIPMDETMTLIKAISKKKEKVIFKYKDRFLKGFTEKILEEENCTKETAKKSANKVWQIIYDASKYGFNASHAYCVANDSAYGADLKANHTYEFYEYMLNSYSEKGKKDKVAEFKKEMYHFYGIIEGEYKFGLDNRKFKSDKSKKTINPSLLSIKGFGQGVANDLYELGKKNYESFLDLMDSFEGTSIQKDHVEKLIKLDYFSQFGDSKFLLKSFDIYSKYKGRKQLSKDKLFCFSKDIVEKYCRRITGKTYCDLDMKSIIEETIKQYTGETYNILEKLSFENDYLGYLKTFFPKYSEKYCLIMNFEKKYNNYIVELCRIKNGEVFKRKVKGYNFEKNRFEVNDVIGILEEVEDGRWKTSEEYITEKNKKGFYQDFNDMETLLSKWKIVEGK